MRTDAGRNTDVSLAGAHVLVVEDQPDGRELVARIITERGGRVSTAVSATEAIARFTEEPPDPVISDIAMPGMNGYQLLNRLRGLEEGRRVPAIALTPCPRRRFGRDRRRPVTRGTFPSRSTPPSCWPPSRACCNLRSDPTTQQKESRREQRPSSRRRVQLERRHRRVIRAWFERVGIVVVSAHIDDIKRDGFDLPGFVDQHKPAAVVFDIAPPYDRSCSSCSTC